ncbi:hypothetical protein D3C72_1953660 [compost metagenome]
MAGTRTCTAASPKKSQKAWITSGVLRITSTYTVTQRRAHAGPCVRTTASAVPSTKPNTMVATDMRKVSHTPSSKSRQPVDRKLKSNW